MLVPSQLNAKGITRLRSAFVTRYCCVLLLASCVDLRRCNWAARMRLSKSGQMYDIDEAERKHVIVIDA